MAQINKNYKGVFYSEFVASWNAASLEGITPLFIDWLKQIEYPDGTRIPNEIVKEIVDFAIKGRPSLEKLAEAYIKKVYTLEVITAEGGTNNDQ